MEFLEVFFVVVENKKERGKVSSREGEIERGSETGEKGRQTDRSRETARYAEKMREENKYANRK